MKKLIVMMVVVLAANLSQAAAVSWNSGAIQTPGVGGVFGANIGNGSTLYTAVMLIYSDIGLTTQITLTGNTSGTANAGSAFAGTTSSGLSVSTLYYAVLTVTKNDKSWIMTSTAASFTTKGTGDTTLNFLTGAGFTTVSNKMPSKWTPVPEPTSLALLGIGLAAIGLRRRFMKK